MTAHPNIPPQPLSLTTHVRSMDVHRAHYAFVVFAQQLENPVLATRSSFTRDEINQFLARAIARAQQA